MERFIHIKVQVDDKAETFCDDQCLYFVLGGSCRLFDMNLDDHENGRKHERCPECLSQEIPFRVFKGL